MNILVFYGLPALLCSIITPAHFMEEGSLNLALKISQNSTRLNAIIAKNGTAKEVDFMDVEAFKSATSSHDEVPNKGGNVNSSLINTATDSSLDPSANLELAKVVGKERGNVDKGSLPRKGAPVDVDNEDIYFAKDDSTKKSNSSPRKGAPVKEPSKPRKGAFLASNPSNNETVFQLNTNLTMSKTKPTASVDELSHLEGEDNGSNDVDRESYGVNYTGLIVGLCVGLILLTLLSVLSVRRIRNIWDQRQYKRLDFLIDGMYNEN